MSSFTLILAFCSALLVSLFSGFPGIAPVLLFFFLSVINTSCLAANVFEPDKNSTSFMAVVSSGLAVLLCGITFSSDLNTFLTEAGLQDPDRVHPLVPLLTIAGTILLYCFFLNRAKRNALLVQKYGQSVKESIDRHTYNPKLNRIRRTMIKEKILTERMPQEEEQVL